MLSTKWVFPVAQIHTYKENRNISKRILNIYAANINLKYIYDEMYEKHFSNCSAF